ncbi:GntR family transcriptional regulator [Microlunatus parietis]|uniref:DNA-binding GntR family transcriptional regulator n=1 Tax=Microlunatus parietis TaxID=682979 RepID=A0A7Y9I4R9_9ACTN|nr:GntR family transcriptional regulator [Microlunatus parietis]NYE69799.1 DNA-binding GntR family transcriptional regulator [Microlunatus parietis]
MVAKLSREVAAVLAAEIRELPAGHRLDGEHAIMKRFGVSRSTVRAALKELHDQYLVRRVQGSGTFVNRRIDYVISRSRRPSLHETIASAGAKAYTHLVGAELRAVPEPVAGRLGLAPGTEAQQLIRMSYIDDEVSGYSEEWISLDVCDHIEVGLRVIESLDQVLRGRGYDPVRAWCRIGLDTPPAAVGERLGLDGPRPTWIVESLTRNRGDARQLMCSTTWTRPDLVRMVLELEE